MHPLLKAGGHALALRLDRLRETIRTAAERLRASLAQLLGETLTDTVRDVFRVAFESSGPCIPPYYRTYGGRHMPSPYRGRDDDDDPLAPWLREEAPGPYRSHVDDEDETGTSPADECEAKRPAWSVATEVGLRVSAWWLRRGKGSRTLLGCLAAGSVVAGLAFLGGPWAAAGLRLTDFLTLLAT
jgi:hypothetical protein